MNIVSFQFAAFVLIVLAVCRLSRRPEFRRLTFLVANAVFLSTMVTAPGQLIPLLAFVALGYGAILLAGKVKAEALVLALTAALVALFAWLKRYPGFILLPNLPFAFTLVGLSYIQFRIIHLIIDVGAGDLGRPNVIGYLNYVFHFPALLSGPIQRFEDFQDQVSKPPVALTWPEVEVAIGRIIRGVLMVAVLGSLTNSFENYLSPIFTDSIEKKELFTEFWVFSLKSAVYLYNIFFNFAGSMEIVIPVSLFLGIRLPENFNQPFRATNFLELWNRWHITLSHWLRGYLFNPSLRVMVERFGTRSNMPYLGVLCFFITFLVIGVWHGPTWIFVVYGFLLAAGVSVNRLWQIWMPGWIGKQGYRDLQASNWYFQLSRSAGLTYLAICQGAFWLDAKMIAGLLTPFGLAMVVVSWLTLVVAGAAFGFVWDYLAGVLERFWPDPAAPAAAQSDSHQGDRRQGNFLAALALGLATSLVFAAALSFGTGYLALSSRFRAAYVVVLIGLFVFGLSLCMGYFDRPFAAARDRTKGALAVNFTALWLSVKVMVGLVFTFLLGSAAPDLIYKAF
jgi:D-alanyl-lipoteichoic acid acyltransferase DltB (MBOAT superfamily)